jgi:ubiquinone/menaquinone biosynthesis C-methylase UbiE
MIRRRALAIAAAALACAASLASGQHARLFPPTRLGELEGPDRDAWQRPEQIMDALSIGDGSVVADLGAGGGWFTVRLARRVGPNGRVYAEDIQPQMIEVINRRMQREGLANRVVTKLGTAKDPGLDPGSLDAVLIVDAHPELEDPVALLRNVARALKPTGVIGIVNFKKDGGGPGPAMEERVDPEQVIAEARAAGLELRKRENFLRYQYLLTFGLPSR